MEFFFSCDWGTSSFRLRLIRTHSLEVVEEINLNTGVSSTYTNWQENGEGTDRAAWFLSVLHEHLTKLKARLTELALDYTPVMISGMASSSLGMMELPYKELPVSVSGSDLLVHEFTHHRHPIFLISGLRTSDDVMRGEETKIIGVPSAIADSPQEQLLILPGTHPKHIVLKDSRIIDFTTFMTGEYFAFLSTKTILAGSVERQWDLAEPTNCKSFIDAVKASRNTSLLHHSFLVRTNEILKHYSREANYHYLSGLLIGEELKSVNRTSVYLLGSGSHVAPYELACDVLGIKINEVLDADQALIRGQQRVLNNLASSNLAY